MKIVIEKILNSVEKRLPVGPILEFTYDEIRFKDDGNFYTQKQHHYITEDSEYYDMLKKIFEDKTQALLNIKNKDEFVRKVCGAKLIDDLVLIYK